MSLFEPLELLADWLTLTVFSIEPQSHLAEAIRFFIADTLKIFILLAVIVFVVSILRSFILPGKIRHFLSKRHRLTGHVLAALIGIVTPFCTCSAIPLFLGFLEAGVPLGVTFSFLVAAPMINEVAAVMLLGLLGWKIALLYIVSGLLIAIVSGLVIGGLKAENLLKHDLVNDRELVDDAGMKWKDRFVFARDYTLSILKKVWPYVLIGIGFGAWMHGYVPMDFLAQYAGADQWYAVPLATLIGIPLYSNAAGIVPLVSVLTEKGVSLGTTLAFMMAVTGLSLPEFMILRRVMKTKLILMFFGIVGVGILFTGYLFNWILG
jgi:uncharacterized protein